MMEGPPPAPERKIEKHEVIERLKANGLEDPETRELVIKWTEQREQEVKTPRDTILLNIDRADFYLAVNDEREALDSLTAALVEAQGEELGDEIAAEIETRHPNLYKKIREEIDSGTAGDWENRAKKDEA